MATTEGRRDDKQTPVDLGVYRNKEDLTHAWFYSVLQNIVKLITQLHVTYFVTCSEQYDGYAYV